MGIKKIRVKVSSAPKKVEIETPFIRLDSFLKLCGAAETGGHAKFLVQNGMVEVGSDVCTMRGKKLVPGDVVACEGKKFEVSSSADREG